MASTSVRTLLLAAGAMVVDAHMQMSNPFPLRSPLNSQGSSGLVDYDMTAPLRADGSNFPCKGYQNDSPLQVTAQYAAGGSYTMSIAGGATHLGGSCQLALSYDNGASFHVIKSVIGGCPTTSTTFPFTIPTIAPSGTALLAWTWMNFEGNREYYMNCAAVQISGQTTDTSQLAVALPNLFVANLAGINSCVVPEMTDAVFPHPGYDVTYGNGEGPSSPPFAGDCDNNSGPGTYLGSGDAYSVSASPIATASDASSSAQTEVYSIPTESAAVFSTASLYSTVVETSTLQMVTEYTATASASPSTEYGATPGEFYPTGASGSPSSLDIAMSTLDRIAPSTTLETVVSTAAGVVIPTETWSTAPFVEGDPNSQYLPCTLGSMLCISSSSFVVCEENASASEADGGSEAYGLEQVVADGMMCLPASSGSYRTDRVVRAQPFGPCSDEGALQCVSDGAGFQMCADGAWVDMGLVAAGTICADGSIFAERRRRRK